MCWMPSVSWLSIHSQFSSEWNTSSFTVSGCWHNIADKKLSSGYFRNGGREKCESSIFHKDKASRDIFQIETDNRKQKVSSISQ